MKPNDEEIDCIRHIAHVGEDKLYLLQSADGSWMCKFAFENRVENEKVRQYVDTILEKISEVNNANL